MAAAPGGAENRGVRCAGLAARRDRGAPLPRLGETVHEIEADGLPIAARLPIFTDNADEPVAKTSHARWKFSTTTLPPPPGRRVAAGDRFEIFAVAAAAAARHIPIAHISGGDVTLGAADEYYRHCITKMAALHFPSCARKRGPAGAPWAKPRNRVPAWAAWAMKTSAPCPK